MAKTPPPPPGKTCGVPTRIPSIQGTVIQCPPPDSDCGTGKSCKLFSRKKGGIPTAWKREIDHPIVDETKEYACFCV